MSGLQENLVKQISVLRVDARLPKMQRHQSLQAVDSRNPTPPAKCKTPKMVAINHQPQLISRILRVNYILFWGDFFDGSKLGYQFAIAKLCPDLSILSGKTWYIYIYIAGSNGGCSGITLPSLFFFFRKA